MNYRTITTLFYLLLVCALSNAQPNIIFDATFDACTALDEVSMIDGVIDGNPTCECAVNGTGYRFDGINDSIAYPNGIVDLLNNDFALSFYFFLDNNQLNDREIDLVSFSGPQCVRDSSLTIRYVPQTNSIRTQISKTTGSFLSNVIGEIPGQTCWNYFVLNKDDDKVEMYINNILVSTDQDFDRDFEFKPSGVLSVGASPCITNFSTRFKGIIDELKIYDSTLAESDIILENFNPDRIISPDETIFDGESVQIQTGNNCTGSFNWSPQTDLDDPLVQNPTARPDETITYQYEVNYGTCVSVDSIRISVVDPEQATCDELLLPNAFTPNNDRRNDTYGISNDFIIDQLKSFEIFSKWGEKVFGTSSLDDKWDGNYKGQPMVASTLLYRVVYDCSGEEFCATGSFVLIR